MASASRPWTSAVSASLAALAACAASLAIANASSVAAPVAPKKIALISMVGDEFSIVVQKQQTGSNIIDHFKRVTLRVPGQAINLSVLRGIDQAVAREYPESERVFLAIPHDNETLPPAPREREAAAYNKAISLIEPMPDRQTWDQIILVTPRFLYSERAGMGSKLSGIGLYIQPLQSARIASSSDSVLLSELGLRFDEEVDTPVRGQTARSETYLAPFFYAVVTTLDAKTMRVIKREERYDFRKLVNPDAISNNIAKSFDTEQLAGLVDKFIETAALRSVTDKRGSVEIGPVRDSRALTTPSAKP